MSGDRLDELDYYTLLSVEPDVSADAIREAFHAFARRYHPDRFAAAPLVKRERAGAIYRRGAEAYRVLMGAETRRRYDLGLARGQLRLAPEETRDPKRPSLRPALIAPRARPFASKAHEAWIAGDYRTARLNLKMALQHEPDSAELKARLVEVEDKLQRR